ncbi:hypothetical protein EDD86DRAFT_211848 [Gorgonomyces haynaldii]|nr:hypothetical protein EDD86DRAFT_211848 [Gorgonomyces haynaldii]
MLKCRQCRQIVAHETIEHNQGVGQQAFEYRKRTTELNKTKQCNSWFLGHWDTGEEIQGRMDCTCGAKLGTFHLAGLACSCGTWVSPAFAVSKSKVDRSHPVDQPTSH